MAIGTIGVLGAGQMGSGIAQVAALAGFDVVLGDVDQATAEKGKATIARFLGRSVEKGQLKAADRDAALGRVTPVADVARVAAADLVIEAASEREALKLDLFRALDRAARPETILASNTSSIPIAELAAATPCPDRVVGLHFFSPVPVMKLVEVVVALETSPETVAKARAVAERLGKTPIQTKDRSGFVVNMLLIPYLMAAVRMYEEGFASREDIDTGMTLGCGHPMGPLALCDLIGLDVLYAVGNSLYEEFKRDEYAPPPLVKRMVAAGRLGRKSGRGFYEYS